MPPRKSRTPLFLPIVLAIWAAIPAPGAEPTTLRVVAANLTSGNYQTYSPDNGNHSNPEGAGARILKALNPDVVLIQEFNTSIPVRQWINQTLGENYAFIREEQDDTPNFIPNGVISRYPIIASGEWDDPTQQNRDFAWAKIALPGGSHLWAVSVHFYSKSERVRAAEARELVAKIRSLVPPEDYLVLGGDLNTRSRDEECVTILESVVEDPATDPADRWGNEATNANRNRPYDWVLADRDLQAFATPVKIAGKLFPGGLVFDSRVFEPLDKVPPVQFGDSAAPQMQHMAVVRDFVIPRE